MEAYTIAGFCLCVTATVMGVPSNLIILYLYFKKKRKSSSHAFIIGHAVVDLVICSVVLPIGAAQFLTLEKFRSEFLCKVVMWLNIAAPLASLNVNTVVAFDRFFAVTRPHSRFLNGKRGPTIIVIIVIVIAFVVNFPQVFWWRIRERVSMGEPSCYLSVHGAARTFALLPVSLLYAILIFTTLVLYAVIYCKVRKLRKNRVVSIHLESGVSAGVNCSVPNAGASTTLSSLSASPSLLTPKVQPHPVRLKSWYDNSHRNEESKGVASIYGAHNITEDTMKRSMTSSLAVRRGGGDEHSQALVNATFRMLFIISAIFISTWLLQTILRFIPRSLTEQLRHESPGWYAVYTLLQYVIVINSCINLVVYAIVNREFRKELQNLKKRVIDKLNKICHR